MLIPFSSASAFSVPSGFFAGASTGLSMVTIPYQDLRALNDWDNDIKAKLMKFNAGYRYVFNEEFFLGAEGYYSRNYGRHKEIASGSKYRIDAKYSAGGNLLLGWLVGEKDYVYLAAGLDNTNYKSKNYKNLRFNKRQPGKQVGFGFEHKFKDWLALQIRYTYTKSKAFLVSNPAAPAYAKFRPYKNEFSIGLLFST